MKALGVVKRISVPTGDIFIVIGERGYLECLSLGDYGKEKNIKATFMGLDREINGVPHGDLLPLSDKWVCTVSTQYGCSMGCTFCDVPKVGPGINATARDLIGQVTTVVASHPEVTYTSRLNIHYARMGEPTWNKNVLVATNMLHHSLGRHLCIHPVVSTMMPRMNKNLRWYIHSWVDSIKNRLLGGNAGLQISVNSTSESQRREMFNGNALSLAEISSLMDGLRPEGRKFTLNFALSDSYQIDADVLLRYFSPDHYLVKITPMHATRACELNGLRTSDGYAGYTAYRAPEEALKKAGYDVIVFVPSVEEDTSRITCGNAALSAFTEEVQV